MALGFKTALIVGAGAGLSASLGRQLAGEGVKVALAARSTEDLASLAREIGAATFACDASKRSDVDKLFDYVEGMVKKFKERIERLEREAKKDPEIPL
jgi:NADP-dependent 3-hydroxy acid dehydrogenase YdfG